MDLVHKAVRTVLGGLLPLAEAIEDPDERRSVLLALTLSRVIASFAPLTAAVFWALGFTGPLAVTMVSGAALLALPEVYRRTGSYKLLTRLLLGIFVTAIPLIAGWTGGLEAPALHWLGCIPLLSVLLIGFRDGLRTLLFALAVVAIFLVLMLSGVDFPARLHGQARQVLAAASIALLSGMLLVFAWGFQTVKRKTLQSLTSTRDQAEQAHRNVQLILDTIHQGLILVDKDGAVRGEYSAYAAEVFGELEAGKPIWEVFRPFSGEFAEWLELGWPTLADPLNAFEIAVAQLPPRVVLDRQAGLSAIGEKVRHDVSTQQAFDIRYQCIEGRGAFAGAVLALEDVSAEVEIENAQRAQRELHQLATRVVKDPGGMREFLEEGRQIISDLQCVGLPNPEKLRLLHTLKGNASLLGLVGLTEACHAVEPCFIRETAPLDDLQPVVDAWNEVDQRLRSFLGSNIQEIDISIEDHGHLLNAIAAQEPHPELQHVVKSWLDERVSRRFERLREQAKALAFRLGKGPVDVEIESRGVRLPEAYQPFWSALVHVIRNALDHGIETQEERVQAGKSPHGHLRFEAERGPDGDVHLSFTDDGAGIDWAALRRRAKARGLPVETMSNETLLFHDGLSSKERVTAVSGRGVGTSAIKRVVEDLGGQVMVRTALGEGTTFDFHFPPEAEAELGPRPGPSSEGPDADLRTVR